MCAIQKRQLLFNGTGVQCRLTTHAKVEVHHIVQEGDPREKLYIAPKVIIKGGR